MAADSGVPSRNRWNDAETTTPTHGRKHGRTASVHGRLPPVRGVARPPPHHTRFFCGWASPTASAAARKDFPRRCHTKAFHWAGSRKRLPWADQAKQWPSPPTTAIGRRIHAMAAARVRPESQNGLSERLSALGGKRTRVRCESPSKTPKNGFWRVS